MPKSILKKASSVGGFTLLSRAVAFIREVLLIQFLGVGVISDAFFTAFYFPNMLRKVFAEGALSSVLVPSLVSEEYNRGKSGVSKLTTLTFIMVQAFVVLLCMGIVYFSSWVIAFIAPGFSAEQIATSVDFLRILVSFILFISSAAIITGALQAAHHFSVPALSPALLNVLYVLGMILCLWCNWSVATFCWMMIGASIINLALHIYVYFKLQFTFMAPDELSWQEFKRMMFQFFPCIVSASIGEVNFFIDTRFASFLGAGTLSLVRYGYRFVAIPLGVLVQSLAIVLLPHFAKLHQQSKEEFEVTVFESLKFVVWMIVPVVVVMYMSSHQIFQSLFFASKSGLENIEQAASIMNAFLLGLAFFAFERILLNVFFALKKSHITVIISLASSALNYGMNGYLMGIYGGMGLAFATSVAAMFRVVVMLIVLYSLQHLSFDYKRFVQFLAAYAVQLLLAVPLLLLVKYGIEGVVTSLLTDVSWVVWQDRIVVNAQFFTQSLGYWAWFPLVCAIWFYGMYKTRHWFRISLLYLD